MVYAYYRFNELQQGNVEGTHAPRKKTVLKVICATIVDCDKLQSDR